MGFPNHDLTPAPTPGIRIVDTVATLSQGSFQAAEGRLVEFQLPELERLVIELGSDGLLGLCAYLRVLQREPGPNGPVLVVDDFSGRWLQENTTLSRNGAYRAQKALEEAGLFSRLISRPGEGARGKQRGMLSPDLVLIPGGSSDVSDDMKRRKSAPGKRTKTPGSQKVGTREPGLATQVPENREPGASVQVNPGLPESGNPTTSSSLEVEIPLERDDPWSLPAEVFIAATRTPDLLREKFANALNRSDLAERLENVHVSLRISGPRTQWHIELADYLVSVLRGDLELTTELTKLNVRGRQKLTHRQLASRLVAGFFIGTHMRDRVEAWGGWLHIATKPEWKPTEGNPGLRKLTEIVNQIDSAQAPAVNEPPRRVPASHTEEPPTPVGEPSGPLTVSEQDIAKYLEQAIEYMGGINPLMVTAERVQDPSKQIRLVQMYLASQGEAAS